MFVKIATWLSASSVCSVYSVGPLGSIGPSIEGLDPNPAREPLHWKEEILKKSIVCLYVDKRCVYTQRLDQSEDFTITWARWSGGIQGDRAQRLKGYIDVVDMVKHHRLFLQGLVGWGCRGGLICPWGLSPYSGGTDQLVASWWSSRSGTLERERDNIKQLHVFWTRVSSCFCPL